MWAEGEQRQGMAPAYRELVLKAQGVFSGRPSEGLHQQGLARRHVFSLGGGTLQACVEAWGMTNKLHVSRPPSFFLSFFYLFDYTQLVLVAAHGIFHLHCSVWGLVPWPGIEPGLPALGAQCLSPGTTREVPHHPHSILVNSQLTWFSLFSCSLSFTHTWIISSVNILIYVSEREELL